MPNHEVAAFSDRVGNDRFVLFAGAGISMGAPSSLPGWGTLNEWILRALFERVEAVFETGDDYLSILLEHRDEAKRFPPDYQAQFLEECASTTCFEALLALDIDRIGPAHRAAAALAKEGRLAANATTNFDQLLELALDEADVSYETHYDLDGYTALVQRGVGSGPLPLIKIHGSVASVESLIDTRKQRRQGRGAALNKVLEGLLVDHAFLYVGFSGSDLAFDKHYLGIRDAADRSPGFCFLHQPGTPLHPEIADLLAHYGAEKANSIEVDGATALEQIARAAGASLPPPLERTADPPTGPLVQARIKTWAGGLDQWLAARMAASLQEAASLHPNALRLLKKARCAPSNKSPHYPNFLVHWVKGRVRRARYDDPDVADAIRFLTGHQHPLAPFFALVTTAFTQAHLRLGKTVAATCREFAVNYQQQLNGMSATDAVDAVLLVCDAASLFEELPELEAALGFACEIAAQDGDDVRQALCRAELAVRLARLGRGDEVEALYDAALGIATEFHEHRIATTAACARALASEHSAPGEAMGTAQIAYQAAVSDELRLGMSRALLTGLRVACRQGGSGNVAEVEARLGPSETGPAHELWAHDLERQLYLAEFHKRMGEPSWRSELTNIQRQARHAGMAWIERDASRLLPPTDPASDDA